MVYTSIHNENDFIVIPAIMLGGGRREDKYYYSHDSGFPDYGFLFARRESCFFLPLIPRGLSIEINVTAG